VAKLDSIYSKFEDLEEQLAHCYFLLQERFITNAPLAQFWAEAALDEMQHSSILRYCREHRLFEGDETVDASMAARVDDLLDTVKRIVVDPEITPDAAFFASLLIESSELDDAYEKLTRSLANVYPMLYQTVRDNLQTHHCRFADGATEFAKDKSYAEAFRALGRYDKQRVTQCRNGYDHFTPQALTQK
jgi:hypothetical protein